MASLKKTLMKQGLKLMSDPRVMKLMQDERVMKAVMAAVAVPGKLQSFTAEQAERIARSMALATEQEVKDLRRTVRRLEEEVSRLQTEGDEDDALDLLDEEEEEEAPPPRPVRAAKAPAAKKKTPSRRA